MYVEVVKLWKLTKYPNTLNLELEKKLSKQILAYSARADENLITACSDHISYA
jgi:hypothetical protein